MGEYDDDHRRPSSPLSTHSPSPVNKLGGCLWPTCTTSTTSSQVPESTAATTSSTPGSQPIAESSVVSNPDAVSSTEIPPIPNTVDASQTSTSVASWLSFPTLPALTPPTSSLDSVSSSETTSVNTPSPSSTAFSESALTRSKTNVGAIAGGVIGGVIILALVLAAVFFRKPLIERIQHARRKRTAPSAEFANVSPRFYSSQSRLTGLSPTPGAVGHIRGNSTFSTRDLQGMSESPIDDDQPPPFTPGAFRDPVMEKVASSARQHEMYLQAHSSPPPSQDDHSNESGSSLYNPYSRNPYILPHPIDQSSNYPLDTSDFPATSPILTSEDHGSVAGPSRSATGHRGRRSPGSAEAGRAV